jgi:hypothetical protein
MIFNKYQVLGSKLLWSAVALLALNGCVPADVKDSNGCKGLLNAWEEIQKKGETPPKGLAEQVQRCQQEEKKEDSGGPGKSEEEAVGLSGFSFPDLPGRSCTIDRFQQNTQEEVVKKVDILFVMDNSGSMSNDWQRVASNIQNLVRELPADIHVRYGVLLAHVGNWRGRIYSPNGVRPVLDNRNMTTTQITRALQTTFSEAMKLRDPSTGEASFHSLFHAVTTSARDNQRLGFFRADAALSVIFMSDEHEIGSPFPNPQAPGLPPRCDGNFEDGVKRDYYDTKGINLESTVSAMRRLKGDMPVVNHAFININSNDLFKDNPRDAKCLYDSLGYGYFDIVNRSRGVLFSIKADRAEGLARCGRVIRERLRLRTEFPLSRPADQVDPATIMVAVDRGRVTHEYRASQNSVRLENAGRNGSTIEIRHCRPITRQEWNITGFSGNAGQAAVALNWRTPEYATVGKVRFGTVANGLVGETSFGARNTEHGVTVEGLQPNTVYYFQAVNRDEFAIEKQSSVISFRTKPDWSIAGPVVQTSRTTASFQWNTVAYPTVSSLRWGLSADALVNVAGDGVSRTNHSVELADLNPGTRIFYQVVASDEFGLNKSTAVESAMTQVDWGIVGFAGTASRESIQVVFSTPEQVTVGGVRFGTAADSLDQAVQGSSPESDHVFRLDDLNPNTLYFYQGVARDPQGREKRTAVQSIRTLADWGVDGFNGSSAENSVTLSWNTGDELANGAVIWGDAEDRLGQRVNSSGSSTAQQVAVNGLLPDTLYYFQAVATNARNQVRRSVVVAIRTQPKAEDPQPLPVWEISGFNGTATKNSVSLSWKTDTYDTTARLVWGLSENALNQVVDVAGAGRAHGALVVGLAPDTLYYFRAVNADDKGQTKQSAVVAIKTLQDAVVDPPPVGEWEIRGFDAATSAEGADVIWQTPGAETKGVLRVGLSPNNLSLQEIRVDQFAETQLVPVSGLAPNTVYYLQVVAVDRAGRTQESPVIMKRTKLP